MDLGLVLRDLERLEEARTELQRSVQLDPGNVQAHAALAQTLLDLGQYEEAEACVGRTLSLLPADHSLRGALEQQRQSGRQMQALERQLPTSLANKAWPTTSGEQLAVAELCRKPRWRRYAAAARLYASAFADPTLAEPVRRQHRYAAVVSAALAGTGHDATPLDTAQMRHWRNQAQEWIKADLTHAQPDEARRRLRRWQRDSALDDLREPTKLTQWSAVEREAWQKLWRELEARLAQDQPRTQAVKRLLREANEV
jgi:tetratricopeptide (TPR) repeat protein